MISMKLKPTLYEVMSLEQFGFLPYMQMHNVVGVAHVALHSIKIKKLKEMVMKVDLKKATWA
jgi:hypothetical protein